MIHNNFLDLSYLLKHAVNALVVLKLDYELSVNDFTDSIQIL